MAKIEPLFKNMRKYKFSKRESLNAVLYLVKTGFKYFVKVTRENNQRDKST